MESTGRQLVSRPRGRDKPCWRCGYSLRLLPDASRNCPECGLAVRLSLNGRLSLSLADPAWLRSLAWAALLTAAAAACMAVALLICGTLKFAPRSAVGGLLSAFVLFASIACVAQVIGWLRLNRPPDHMPYPYAMSFRRRILYGTVPLVAVILTILMVLLIADRTPSYLAVVYGLAWYVAMMGVQLMQLSTLRDLLRLDGPRALRRTVDVAWFAALMALVGPLWAQTVTIPVFCAAVAVAHLAAAGLWCWTALILRREQNDAIEAWVSD